MPRKRKRMKMKVKMKKRWLAKKVVPKKQEKQETPPPTLTLARPAVRRQILFCPGPVNLTPHVKAALGGPEMCHREPEFGHLLQTVRAKLIHALGLDQRTTAVLIGGSGTAALEAAVSSLAETAKKILVINNGVYGSRIAQLARIHQIPCVEIRSPLTERPDLSRVAAALKRDPQIATVAMVHHETSTGMLNPVEEVGRLAKKFHRRFLVDAISSLGAEPLALEKNHVGLCVGSAGKCLHGPPGLSFVLLSEEESSRLAKGKLHRSLYLDLSLHLRSQEGGEPPFTPAIPLIVAFHAAVDELIREKLKVRIARYRQRALFLRQGFKKMGLRFLLDEKLLSNTLTSLWLPKGMGYPEIHDRLKKLGYIVYAGQSELKGKILRVAHMGHLLQSDLKDFLQGLKGVLAG